MNQSFDINVLREEARTRWLKPSEVYYILQNHERFPITHEAPKKPPSGSLFLYNRRVNRYFRRDGHTWRRKKDGRTVGEAHERLKVGNVDALSCYYAHGEQNPCFQRRCFWMLEPAYEHIVLVQYREVAEGRYYSSQLSNGPPESLSSLVYPNVMYGNQYLSSGTSEGSESHQSYSNLSSVTEVSSYSGNKEYNRDGSSLLSIPELGQTCLEQTTEVYDTDNGNSKNKSGLNVALKKIAEQLSLGDDDNDDYIYSNQAQHLGFATDTDAAGGNQVKQMQPEGTKEGLCRNVAPSWEDVLHSSSGLPTPSIYQARARLNQERRKPYVTLESASTEELGVTTDRLLIKRKRRVPAKEAKGKRVVENVRRSKFTEVGKQHFTFHKDVNAWIDIKKQYEGGHTCIQQIVHKLVGRKDIKQMIMKKILLDRNGGSNCTVICIDAGSGHGKTSLLHALYNDQLLTDTFDKSIWIQLSDKFDMVMLFRKIVEVSMNDHCSTANLSCLQEMVKEEIAEKKLLLFLDDADIEDQQFWSTVLEALNAGAKGSAVIMATRSSTVSTFRNLATHSYSLDPLSKENNLMIFQQYSVVGTDILSNPDLLMVAQRFISRFGSNPLNLKAIGGLLCHAESISLEMDDFDESVMPLQLCHDVLPIHLKKCLAFCSLFPEGYIFDKHHMVLRWISHGSVRPAEGCELEDVGVEYFNELLCRCFFQYSPVHSNKDDKFVIPKLMYKVVESVNRDKYFKSEDPTSSIPESILHLSLVSSQFQTVELISKTQGLNDLQTFMVVQPECQPYKISFPTLKLVGLDDFFLKFTSLETLDLSHTDTEELPGSIVGLRNLQYLSVNNTSIRTLPSQLCRLSNLQTLEAKDCRFLTELPGDTKKLLKLHHLDLTKELGYVHLPHGIGQLTELRTLPVFHANGDSSRCSISELGNLHSLRGCLRLSGLESVETGSKAQEANLKGKHHLKDLTLQWHDGGVDIDDEDEDAENVAEQVLESLQPHTNLQELAIRGYEGSVFPAWMQDSSSLPNLVSLTFDSCCNCTQFPAIAQLPSLKFLSIRKMYDVQRLTNNIHGATKFPSLELLNLWEMYGLEELFESSDGDCPRLRKVCISRCPSLKRLPCTPSLTELVLHCGQQLPAIPELVSLVSLKIEGFHALRSIKLPAAAALKKLEITSCKELLSVDGLSAMTTVLQRLKVAGCPKLVLPRTDHLTA